MHRAPMAPATHTLPAQQSASLAQLSQHAAHDAPASGASGCWQVTVQSSKWKVHPIVPHAAHALSNPSGTQ